MPTLETEYDRFSYGETEPSLSLDEAVKRASELRQKNPGNFYRICSNDEKLSGFRVKTVSAAEVYSDFIARMAKTLGKLLSMSAMSK
jgi:hypothetical protein